MPYTRRDELRLQIRMGLTKGLNSIRGMRRQLDEAGRDRVAEAVLAQFELAGYTITPGGGIGGHSNLWGTTEADSKRSG